MVASVPRRDETGLPVGWRWWTVDYRRHVAFLTSPVVGTRWEGRSQVASCRFGHPTVPARSCTCGIAAYNDLDDALRRVQHHDMPTAVGLVHGLGRLILEADGWRASTAELVVLLLVHSSEAEAAAVAARYDVPALPISDVLEGWR